MTKPKPTLADHVADPDLYLSKGLTQSPLPMAIRQHKVYVFDEEATSHALSLSTNKPLGISQLIDVAEPPYDHMFIEMPSAAVTAFRRWYLESKGVSKEEAEFKFPPRPVNVRMGIVISRKEDILTIQCIEHGQDHEWPRVFEWPVYFEISLSDFRFEKVKEAGVVNEGDRLRLSRKGALSRKEQEGRLWGFEPDTPGLMAHLKGRARLGISEHWAPLIMKDAATKVNDITKELTGFTRMALGCLAVLNIKMTALQKVEPKARHMKANRKGSKRLLDYSFVTMSVPGRVKNVDAYIRRQVRAESAKKRYHEVQGHYRHVKAQPSTPGWKEVTRNGETYWRKRIAPHHRGDIELGVVDRHHTVVKGDQPND